MFILTLSWLLVAAEIVSSENTPTNGRHAKVKIRRRATTSSTTEPPLPRPWNENISNDEPYQPESLAYRLTRLEIQTAEKSESVRTELMETNQRLRALEWQSAEVGKALEQFKNELIRFRETPSTSLHSRSQQVDKLESRVDNLAKGIQVAIYTLKGIHGDFPELSKNITDIASQNKLLLMHREDLVTKAFLTSSLVDLKHQQLFHSLPSTHNFRSQSETEKPPKNCKEVQEKGIAISGIYNIQPSLNSKPFLVMCDLDTAGGGWTYLHNRFDGSQDFYLNWHSYKVGFGNLGGEFWLGLEHLHQLTGYEVNELMIELLDSDLKKKSAYYSAFSIGDEQEGYALKVLGGYSGNSGDSLIYHAGSKFSTKDMDQDGWPEGNCAQAHGGAWWYKSCDTSNLNGKYLNGSLSEEYLYQGMYWAGFHGPQYGLSRARMLIRPYSGNNKFLDFDD